jgi:8-oxo-dGTP diphosphatase
MPATFFSNATPWPCCASLLVIQDAIPLSTQPVSAVPASRRRGVIAVVPRRSQLLVIRRSLHVRAPRAYCFPGGGIEAGESEEEALARELEEELSARAQPVRRLYENATASGVHLVWWLAILEPASPLIPNPREVESLHWLTVPEIRALPGLLLTNHDFLNALGRLEFSLESS